MFTGCTAGGIVSFFVGTGSAFVILAIVALCTVAPFLARMIAISTAVHSDDKSIFIDLMILL